MRATLYLFVTLVLIACHTSKKTTKETPIVMTKSDSIAGLDLIKNSNCFTCHKIKDDRLIGPNFMDIAAKYAHTAESVDGLAKKILNGGNGVWDNIPMVPHPDMTEEDAKTVVKYILSLKT